MITIKDITDPILGRWCRLLFNPIYKWYYSFFSMAALCISGLVFSHSMVEFAVLKLLEDYLSSTWTKQHLGKLTAIINLQDGVSAVSAIIVAHIADCYAGRFNMILLSALTYITGLVLLGFSTNVGIYVGLLAVALGRSGCDPVLKDFLADQMSGKKDLHKDEERIEDRTKVWWRIAWFLGAIIGFCLTQFALWTVTFLVSILVMGASFWIFWIGFFYYDHHDLVQTPLNICYRVFMTAISKRHLSYPSTSNEFHWNSTGGILLLPEVRFFRWLDKAAIKSSREGHGMFCTVKEVSDVKRLLTMIPMWANFIPYCLIQATGNTLFIEQSSNLDNGDAIVPVILLHNFINFYIPKLFGLKKVRQKCGPLKKIGAGLVCSIACCAAAWQVEIRRLYLIKEKGIDPDAVDPEQTISMSVYSLIPQFVLLALMQSLAGDGLEEFVVDHIPDSMKRYGSAFNECVLGFGYFLSAPLPLLFRRWFGDTINRSHLKGYYLFLVIFSSIFFGIYVYLSPKYALMELFPSKSKDMELLELENGARVRWKRLVNVTTATLRFYSPLATVKGMQSTAAVQYHESMEVELPLRSHYPSAEDEELVPDDEPGSLQVSLAEAEIVPDD